VLWQTLQEPGLEHLALSRTPGGLRADGLVIGVVGAPPRPFRLRYRVDCDAAYRVRAVTVAVTRPRPRRVALRADGRGTWRDRAGAEVAALRGCIDVDIMTSPFTNLLPIRRLAWTPGQTAEIDVVYVVVPELRLETERQRYTCLDTSMGGGRYRFESLASGFAADLRVDADGLVTTYGDLWRRVPAG